MGNDRLWLTMVHCNQWWLFWNMLNNWLTLFLFADELDDQLLPVGKEIIRYEDEESEWDDPESHSALPGTTKRKQCYQRKVSFSVVSKRLKSDNHTDI